MNSPLLDALSRMGLPEAQTPEAWKALMLVRNFSPVPPLSGEVIWGFKFLLGNPKGDPAWFGRCGWAPPDTMERECQLLLALQAEPSTSRHTPEVRVDLNGHRTVQVSRHLGHSAYTLSLPQLSPTQWTRDVDEILTLSERIMSTLKTSAPNLFCENPAEARRESFGKDCKVLRLNGIQSSIVDRLEAAVIEHIDNLPVLLQHGDLWPANVLRAEERWWLIDYTECGMVWVPGYDLFSMLINQPTCFSTSWIAPEKRPRTDMWDKARRAIIKQFCVRHGLNSLQLSITQLYSLLHIAAYRMRDGVSEKLGSYWKHKIIEVDKYLTNKNSIDTLVTQV